jgi:hypothetical protein
MNPYRQYRNARMEFNHLRRYIRLCRAWADDGKNFRIMVDSGWGDIVETEATLAKARMDTLRQAMESIDPDNAFRVRFEKEMKR